jgi:hypothetical protein
LMMSNPLRNFTRHMHMIPAFLFVPANKDLMTLEWLSGIGFCAQGKDIHTHVTKSIEPSTKVFMTRESRFGYEAYIYVKRSSEGMYQIAAPYEGHNHDIVTPRKRHLL